MLGTVFGLAGVVGNLDLTRGVTSQLNDALAHMRSAFACTIWGILASLGTAIVVRFVTSRHSDFLANLQKFAIRKIAPRVFPAAQDVALDSLERLLTEIERLLTESTRYMQNVAHLMSQAAGHFSKTLEAAGQRMEDSIHGLNAVSQTIKGTADAVNSAAGNVGKAAFVLQDGHTRLEKGYETILRSCNGKCKNSPIRNIGRSPSWRSA